MDIDMLRLTRYLVGLGIALPAPGLLSPLAAQGASDPAPAVIDSVFARYDHTNVPGCALGVFRNDRIVYSRGYGMADLNQNVPITPSTVFYVASTSKQFAAFATALLAEEGKISLDDPIRKWFPELPAYADSIRVRHLVHHTSGIRDYLGLWGLSGRSFADEILQEVGLDLVFRQKAADFAPGARYSYSNSGYLLLSELVKRASGQSLREYTTAKMFAPLGMTSTHFHDDNAMIVPRRAEGYQPLGGGRFEIFRTSFALVGDGGLLTSVEDLLKWDANFYDNKLGRGGPELIRQVTTPGRLANGTAQTYAFGLMIGKHRGLDVVEHGGSFIGFRAQLTRFPTEHFSVAVLCNDYTAQPEQMALQVAEKYLGGKMTPVPARTVATGSGVAVLAERLDRLVGAYELLPGMVARVAKDGNALAVTAFGNRSKLVPSSDSTFESEGPLRTVTFVTTPAGPALVTGAFGGSDPAPRLAPAGKLSPATAAGYAGRYLSEELDTWSTIEVKGDTLRARTRWGSWATLEPLGPDLFVVAGSRLAFERDRKGAVTGYRLSQARTRNVGFVRAPASR